MSLKKKLGSKLAQGVRQVKTQRDPAPAVTPAATPAAPATASNKPAPAKAAVTPAPRTAQPSTPGLAQQHPRRVWPD